LEMQEDNFNHDSSTRHVHGNLATNVFLFTTIYNEYRTKE